MMKLYKYKGYNAQNNNIIHGWENKEPFIYTDEVFSDYVDIHTIVGMYNNGSKLFNFNQQRIIISGLFYEKAGTSLQNYGTLTDNEKFIGSQLFLLPYSLRVTSGVLTDGQDTINWNILVEKTQGTPVQQYEGRALVAELMRQHVGSGYLRKDLMTYTNSKLFGRNAHLYIEWYIKYADYSFYNWLTNAVGTEFENDGFAQKTYLSTTELMTQLKDELLVIYNKG